MYKQLILLGILSTLLNAASQAENVDWAIHSDQIYPGDGSGPVSGVLVLDNGRVRLLADGLPGDMVPARTLRAMGQIVAPGFIDPHTHACADFAEQKDNLNANYLTQGVTTVFCSNDGGGPVEVGQTLDNYQQWGIGTNVALFIGHGSVRNAVLGKEDRAPTATELTQMQQLVGQAMQQGALGLSSGLFYVPGSYASAEEVIALAKVAAGYGGIYDSHIRDESSYNIGLLASVDEVIQVAQEANIPAHISHIKALGVDVWGQSRQVIEKIDHAREQGLAITANQYPWRASGTSLIAALVPAWAREGGHAALLTRLRDPAQLGRIRHAMQDNLRRRGGAQALLIVDTSDLLAKGHTLAELAKSSSRSEIETALALIKLGDVRVASFNMADEDIVAFMRQGWVMTASDGSQGHPRKFGSFPKKYADFVRDGQVISLTDFIHRSSALTASTFGLSGRGRLASGMAADVLIFDPGTYRPLADFSEPERLSEGVSWLWVNGKVAIEKGQLSGIKAGQMLRGSGSKTP
ncbi:N-acyl-D-amino-acid deacylase family protein [Bowmanella dokdonensis]|uniref:Amidohydrolase family protein n=1 Tax=Bowmanella dokdonensis TaxID=751969 RepID=A0A939IM97_9ALTE|nr:amidohydrolase family protein [Bowmanella dokdonensis]MBN7825073.1 amidohydrolase family protein [Bowmanella dokdonensis]